MLHRAGDINEHSHFKKRDSSCPITANNHATFHISIFIAVQVSTRAGNTLSLQANVSRDSCVFELQLLPATDICSTMFWDMSGAPNIPTYVRIKMGVACFICSCICIKHIYNTTLYYSLLYVHTYAACCAVSQMFVRESRPLF